MKAGHFSKNLYDQFKRFFSLIELVENFRIKKITKPPSIFFNRKNPIGNFLYLKSGCANGFMIVSNGYDQNLQNIQRIGETILVREKKF